MESARYLDKVKANRTVSEELLFLSEFRREGLRSSLYAAYAALGLLALFMHIQELSNKFTWRR